MPNARELYRGTAHVIGQEKARKQLAVLLERQQLVQRGILPDAIEGAVLAGNTGAGKTFLARSMCSLAGLPFAEVNATQYTDAGYVGLNLPQMFLPLLASAAKMIDEESGVEKQTSPVMARDDLPAVEARAARGVVVLDEFDKWMLGGPDTTGRNTGKKLQAELLKMVEGSTEWVSDDEEELGVAFDTTRVLIICAGAFVGLQGIASRRLGGELSENEALWDLIEPSDFVIYGLLPELAGRLSTHVFVRPLREEHLAAILLRPGGIVEEYRQRFQNLGVEWAVPDEAIRTVAREALARGTGARAVNHVMWSVFSEALYEASAGEGSRQVVYQVNNHRATVS